jgi:hypothetical protein
MNKLHRPALTLWHIAVCCLLVAVTARPEPEELDYSADSRQALADLVAGTSRPKGYVVYDSHARAAVIAAVWNITPENEDSYKRWGLK